MQTVTNLGLDFVGLSKLNDLFCLEWFSVLSSAILWLLVLSSLAVLTSVTSSHGWLRPTKSFKAFMLGFLLALRVQSPTPDEYCGGIRPETKVQAHELFLMHQMRTDILVNRAANSNSRIPSATLSQKPL